MNHKGILTVLSGPSGSGKDSILSRLAQKDPQIVVSVSMTTRKPREWEIDGKSYYFVTEDYFKKKIETGQMLEYAVYGGNYYGTPKAPVDQWLSSGKTVVLKIEVQGAQKIREMYPDSVSVFLMPPSMAILEQRLKSRETEDPDEVARRLSIAAFEIEQCSLYDYFVINDELDEAVDNIYSIIKAEKLRTSRMKEIICEVIKDA
ncbi:MAG TPA: guanylate kinase [Clostridiales bacterium]|nr:guanylate kinase [Clostridiales bacterium]HQH62553.1 guanylate kinase [Clostridiales bacterium]HQK74398.1 guanylate kinase [Clostridiales bacterium]